MLADGKMIAKSITEKVAQVIKKHRIEPLLGVVIVGENPVIESEKIF